MLEKIKLGLVAGVMAMGLTACGGSDASSMMEDTIDLTEKATGILKDIKDEKTAEAAKDDLAAIAKEMKEIEKKGREMTKDMKPEDAAEMFKEMAPLLEKMTKIAKTQADEMARIAKASPKAAEIVGKAMTAK